MPTTTTTAASTTRAACGLPMYAACDPAAGAARAEGPRAATGLRLLAAASLVVLLGGSPAAAQVCGDVNGDDNITVTDAQRVLKASVGQEVELVCTDQCAALEDRLAAVEALLAHVTVDGNNLVLTGMNFQVVSGSGETDGTVNGKGNIIIGYNETNEQGDKSTGSHNLIIGMNHSYTNYAGIVAGEDNEILGAFSSVLGGFQNRAEEDGSVIVAGQDNETDGETSVILGGEFNHTFIRSCSIVSGTLNACTGFASSVGGGSSNVAAGDRCVVGGTSNRNLGTSLSFQAGNSIFN